MAEYTIRTWGLTESEIGTAKAVLAQYLSGPITVISHEEVKEVILHTPVWELSVSAKLKVVFIHPVNEYALAAAELSETLDAIVVCESLGEPARVLAIGVRGQLFPEKMVDVVRVHHEEVE